jgi:taurine transport system permease protein
MMAIRKLSKERADYMKAVDRIFKRIDDGKIFPAVVMAEMQVAVQTMLDQAERSKGSLRIVEMLFFPAGDIVKSRTQCTEQGPGAGCQSQPMLLPRFLRLPILMWKMAAAIKAPPYYGGNGFQFQMLCPL